MQDHHRELIRREAEAWKADAPAGIERSVEIKEARSGMIVALDERGVQVWGLRRVEVYFTGQEMPLSPRMVKERFANPFGGK